MLLTLFTQHKCVALRFHLDSKLINTWYKRNHACKCNDIFNTWLKILESAVYFNRACVSMFGCTNRTFDAMSPCMGLTAAKWCGPAPFQPHKWMLDLHSQSSMNYT